MSEQDQMPDRLGQYRLLERIGEGGMGVVFLARDPGQRPVALKVLRPGVAAEPTARRRLAREVETMRRVRSPHVAEVVDAELTGEIPYIVTRYVPGRTLDEIVAETGPLRGGALAGLACGLADALAAVHAAGVVHRDLKPGNVILASGSPVIIDFGIAQGADTTRLTMTGMFMGTPGYLAPEVIEGRPSSEASDVHAWAATIAFAATGRPPFGAGPYETIFYRILNGQPDLAGVPLPLLPILAAALTREPGLRPSALTLSAQSSALDPASLIPPPAGAPGAGSGLSGGAAGSGPLAAAPLTRADRAQADAVAAPGGGEPAGPQGDAVPVGAPGGSSGVLADGSLPDPLSPNGGGWAPGGAHGGWYGVPVAVDGLPADGTRPFSAPPPADDYSDLLPPAQYQLPAPSQPPADPGRGTARASFPGGTVAKEPLSARGQSAIVVAFMVLLAGVSVVIPVLGTAATLSLVMSLRAGELAHGAAVRRRARGARASDPYVAAVSFPWFLVRSVLACILLAPFALAAGAVAGGISIAAAPGQPLPRALAYAAGAIVAFYGIGPGSSRSRRQLGRLFGAATRTRFAGGMTLAGMVVLAVAALAAAATWPSVYWPATAPARLSHLGVAPGAGWRHFSIVAHYLLTYLGR